MRVPNVTTSENILDVIRKMDRRQLQLQQQISDGQKITLPEDDGMKMGRLIRMETEKGSMVQYQRNSSYAKEYLDASYLNLDKLRELGIRSQELARTSGSGVNHVAMETNAMEVNQLLEEAFSRANATHRKRALFGGTLTSPKFGATDVIRGQRFEKKLSLPDNYVPEHLKPGDKFTLSIGGRDPYVIDTSSVVNEATGEVALTASSVAALFRDKVNADSRKTGIHAVLDANDNLILYGSVDEDFEVSATYESEPDPAYDYPNFNPKKHVPLSVAADGRLYISEGYGGDGWSHVNAMDYELSEGDHFTFTVTDNIIDGVDVNSIVGDDQPFFQPPAPYDIATSSPSDFLPEWILAYAGQSEISRTYVVGTSTVIDQATGATAKTVDDALNYLADKINEDWAGIEVTAIFSGTAEGDGLAQFDLIGAIPAKTGDRQIDLDVVLETTEWKKDLAIESTQVPEATTISLSHPTDWQRLTSYNRGELVYYNDKIWESKIDENFNHYPDSNLAGVWKEVDSTHDVAREDWDMSVSGVENRQYHRTPDGWLYESVEEAQQHVIDVLNQGADRDTPQEILNSMYLGIEEITMSVALFEAMGSESSAARVTFDPRTLEYHLTASNNGDNIDGSRFFGLNYERGPEGKTADAYRENDVFIYNGEYYKAMSYVAPNTSLSNLPEKVGENDGKFLSLGSELPNVGYEMVLDDNANQDLIEGQYLHDVFLNNYYLVLEDFQTHGPDNDQPFDPDADPRMARVDAYESPQGTDWNRGRTYNRGDLVFYDNRYWECLKDNFDNTAFDSTMGSPTFAQEYVVQPNDEFIHSPEGDRVQNNAWLPVGETFGHVAKFRVDRTDWPQVTIAPPANGGEGAEAEAVIDARGRLVGVRLTKSGSYSEDGLDLPASAVIRAANGIEVTVDVLGDNGKIFGFELRADENYDLNFPSTAHKDDTFSFATGKQTFLAHRNEQGEIIDVSYNGNDKNAEAYVGKDSKISYYLDASNGGTSSLRDMTSAMIDLRDALRNAKPSTYASEVEGANQKLIALEDEIVDKLGEVASKMTRIETVQRHDEEYFMNLDKRIAKDIDVDLSEAIVRMTQATTAYQASIQVGAHIMNTSLLNYL